MQSELTDAKHELLKIQEMLEMAEKVTFSRDMLHCSRKVTSEYSS